MSSVLTLDQAYPQFATSHYLVQFRDKQVTIVPSQSVSFPPHLLPSYICTVCRPGRKISEAVVLGSGSRESLEQQLRSTFHTPHRPTKRKAGASFIIKSPRKKLKCETPRERVAGDKRVDSWFAIPQEDSDWYRSETQEPVEDEDTESLLSPPKVLSDWYLDSSQVSIHTKHVVSNEGLCLGT